jgi:hypothetical protein
MTQSARVVRDVRSLSCTIADNADRKTNQASLPTAFYTVHDRGYLMVFESAMERLAALEKKDLTSGLRLRRRAVCR